jgi:hypothetical protein
MSQQVLMRVRYVSCRFATRFQFEYLVIEQYTDAS